MDCEHYDNGLCRYATAVADIPIHPMPHNCKNCKKHDSADNPILYSLCVVTLHKQGLLDKVKHKHLVEKTQTLSQATAFNKPGTCLRSILHKIGISEGKTCKCDEYAAQMDAWGTAGCVARRDEIIKHLDSQSVSWLDMARVAIAGYVTTGQLVDECIKQSKVIRVDGSLPKKNKRTLLSFLDGILKSKKVEKTINRLEIIKLPTKQRVMSCDEYRTTMTSEEVVTLIEKSPPGPWIKDWHQNENVKAAHRTMVDRFIPSIDSRPIQYPQQRGIVIAGGGIKYLPSVWVGVNLIREQGCKLPIQLWHLGDGEVDPFVKRLLAPLGVECVDAKKVVKEKPFRILCGWELKLYSVWNSPFEEVLFLDADSSPVCDVTGLFDRPNYVKHGAAFWPDYDNWKLKPDVWEIFGIDRLANAKNAGMEPALESGQFMVHKNRSSLPFQLAMWYAAHSDFTFGHVYGDKETFHLAWRKLGLDYATPRRAPGWVNHTIVQWDIEDTGKVVFQHRVQDKWKLTGTSRFTNSLVNELRSQQLCDILRSQWNGVLWENPDPTPQEKQVMRQISGRKYLYTRVGHDSREIILGVSNEITIGKSECETRWWINTVDDEQVLTISRKDRPTCHLRKQADGSWSGSWIEHEQMPITLKEVS